jgi:hypothetical protein
MENGKLSASRSKIQIYQEHPPKFKQISNKVPSIVHQKK